MGKGDKECDHYWPSHHSSHKIQSYIQTCPFKGNLLAVSVPVHSTACEKGRKIVTVINQIIAHQSWCIHKHVHSMVTLPPRYELRYQFTVQHVEKLWSLLTRLSPTTQNPNLSMHTIPQTYPFRGNLLAESAPVHIIASGERRTNCSLIDQVITHHTKLNPKYL